MILDDWYNSYQKMIQPGTAVEVLDHELGDSSEEDLIDGILLWEKNIF